MLKSLCMWCGLVAMPISAASLDELTFITEVYPPFNYQQDGKLHGLSSSILEAVLKHVGSTTTLEDVRVLPWVRGYETVLTTPNTVLFSTTRTEAREDLFKWVGPIAPDRVVLLARRQKNIELPSIDLLNESDLVVAVINEDIGEQRLYEGGVHADRMRIAITNRSALNMLARDRVDLWAYGEEAAYWLVSEHGYSPSDFESVYVLSEAELYFALNPETDDRLVNAMQQALDELRANGTIKAIMKR